MKQISILLVAMLGAMQSMAAVTLPIEVLGAPGHVETVEVPLPEGSPEVTAMSLRVHGLNTRDKMSLRLNDSPDWITLNPDNVTFPFPDGKLWGMTGVQATIRMIVPLPRGVVHKGRNTIQFRFNDRDGLSIGYRVLAFNFLATPDSQPLIPASEFVQENPSTWKPPVDSVEAIAEGKKLWYSAHLWENGRPIRVACSDCHAQDGRDLKYFNYSNRSIIERSIYHQLTREQGGKIASYIRSLPIPYEENGRPWNPPYQPGPGLDSKPVRSWAAGAGLEWVLDRDYDTLKYIFPDEASIDSYNFSKTTNAREIPLYVQFPDWNQWLTHRHPIDRAADLGKPDGWIPPLVDTFNGLRSYVQQKLNSEGRTAAIHAFVYMCNEVWNRKLSDGPTGMSVSKWRITKIWEMMQEFEFEGASRSYFGPQGNPRSWLSGEVFRAAPHLNEFANDKRTWVFESMLWYQLQLVLNDSNRRVVDTHPVAFEYLQPFSNNWGWEGLPPSYSIMLLDKIKAGEASADYQQVASMSASGWYAHLANPNTLFESKWVSSEIDRLNPSLKKRIAIALATAWLDKSEKFSAEEYRAKGWTEAGMRVRVATPFATLPTALESVGANPELIQRARKFVVGINPELGTVPAAPTNLRQY
ncbi:MAG: hypothetical protein RLZ45_2133 [Verrucomicrobiota bacterium]